MKRTHIEHIEDCLFDHPNQVLLGLEQLKNKPNLSLKFDGSVSIVFGIYPDNKQFFIGTKSAFNKVPKVFFNNDDIIENTSSIPHLMKTLLLAFPILKKYYKGDIVQADVLFTAGEVESYDDDGQFVFTPNALSYVTDEAVNKAVLGLAIHTRYCFSGTTHNKHKFANMNAYPYHHDTEIKHVWLAKTRVKLDRTPPYLMEAINKTKTLLSKYMNGTSIADDIRTDYKIFYNMCIREQIETNRFDEHYEMFINWVVDRYSKRIAVLKTESARSTHMRCLEVKLNSLYLIDVRDIFKQIVSTRNSIDKVKMLIDDQLCYKSNVSVVENDRLGKHEGCVINTGHMVMKLVNRREFSYKNFEKNKK